MHLSIKQLTGSHRPKDASLVKKFAKCSIKVSSSHPKVPGHHPLCLFKRKSTQLTNGIKADIKQYDQDSWTEWLVRLNQEDLSIYDATIKFSRKFHQFPPIFDTDRLKFTTLGKVNAFKYSLENFFQTNPESYDNRHISKVNKAVQNFLNSQRNDNNIKLTSPPKIQAIIKKINPKKATGPNGIPNKALKMFPSNLLTCITKVFNKCLQHHYFSPSWKIAHVLMFEKPGQNHKLAGNYRPISLLSYQGKHYQLKSYSDQTKRTLL
ncbi:hypothetical protein AVEN_20595-1 [Araneus ventricosus]|uniref:RNA-directed DNA polymerase from transposon X-element n=1 Tax=Araneus ventricosus TaxID=182803 RepID=A0A4Y2W2C6_ARAVE|nr:hypothetical protein AVEN_20595-1 [Araneus ventricosus]